MKKITKEMKSKDLQRESYSKYCPVIDQVVVAKDAQDRDKKVQKLIKDQEKNK